MSTARDQILGRIRGALADAPVAPEVPREYRRAGTLDEAARVEQLVDRLEDYKAGVQVVTADRVPAAIAAHLRGAESFVTPEGLGAEWLGELEQDERRRVDKPGQRLSVTELDATSAVVTASKVTVSESGTIILDASPDQGRRAITLVPDHHVCIVPASTVVQLLPEAMERLDITHPLTWISGPSATSDIELERVEGVHGPRTLDVLIASDR